MDKEERAWGVVFAILAISGIFIGIINWKVEPATLLPLIPIARCVIIVILFILPVAFVIRKRKKIGQYLNNKYLKKLIKEIQKDLEEEVTIKNLTFSTQAKDVILSELANQVSSDIMKIPTPKKYFVQPAGDKKGDVWIGENVFSIPFISAEILANKMTEISKNIRYRKNKVLFYLFS